VASPSTPHRGERLRLVGPRDHLDAAAENKADIWCSRSPERTLRPKKTNDHRSARAWVTTRLPTQPYLPEDLNHQEISANFEDFTAVFDDRCDAKWFQAYQRKVSSSFRRLQIREKCQGVCSSMNIEGDSGGKTNILGEDFIGYCEKKLYINVSLILNCYRDRAVGIYKYKNL
jgi:hypothetical protein